MQKKAFLISNSFIEYYIKTILYRYCNIAILNLLLLQKKTRFLRQSTRLIVKSDFDSNY